jgi:hypothetical protein
MGLDCFVVRIYLFIYWEIFFVTFDTDFGKIEELKLVLLNL